MLGHTWLCDPERLDQVPDRALFLAEEVQDAAAVGIGDCLERAHGSQYAQFVI